jgi:hypothetical protein
LTTDAGRSTTSPAATWLASMSESTRIFGIAPALKPAARVFQLHSAAGREIPWRIFARASSSSGDGFLNDEI